MVLLGFVLGCGCSKPPGGAPVPINNWHDHTGPDKAYTVRFPAAPERVLTTFEYTPRDHAAFGLGPLTARGTTLRTTVNRVTYELTEYEGAPDIFGPLCD